MTPDPMTCHPMQDWQVELLTEHARTTMAGTPAEIARIAEGTR